jgi:cation diffusion facilitator CzcD-associated flavoprotein CzcO
MHAHTAKMAHNITECPRRFSHLKDAVSLTAHPATLPEADVPDDVDLEAVTTSGLNALTDLAADHLAENVIWRDMLALTGTLRTFFRPKLVSHVWREQSAKHSTSGWKFVPQSAMVMRLGPETSWVQANLEFGTSGGHPAKSSGTIGLIPDPNNPGTWKIWLLCTVLEQPEGFLDVDELVPGPPTLKLPGLDEDAAELPPVLDCLIVGAAIGGLGMAGRLKSLGLNYLVVERHSYAGETWYKDRYDGVKLHTSKAYSQLPGLPLTFGPDAPYHLSADDLAQGFQDYVKTFGINVLTSTTLTSSTWDAKSKLWTAHLQRAGQEFTLKARHIVLAVGNNGIQPYSPSYANRHLYKGEVIHSANWKNATPWKDQNASGIVVGSANTAHDLIAHMAAANFKKITMLQRSKTFIFPASTFSALVDPVFNDDTPTPKSDRMAFSMPLPVQRLMAMAGIRACADANPEYFAAITKNGYNAEPYGDLWGLINDKEGGHFFDIGSGQLIADGTVRVRSDAQPVSYTETGLELSDGSRVDADVIVFATGYKGNFKGIIARTFEPEVVEKLQEFWQCDIEGEIRGAWKETGREYNLFASIALGSELTRIADPALWYTGHGFAHSRFMSRFVAMRIKAEIEGKGWDVYTVTPDV